PDHSSFPTRRSSDLLVFAGITFAAVELLVWMLPNLKQLTLMQLLLASPAIGLVQLSIGIILFNQTERQWLFQKLQGRWRKRASTDRKSTRLNSSHVK